MQQPSPRAPPSHSAYGSTSTNGNSAAGPSNGAAAASTSRGREGSDEHKARPRVLFMGPRSGGKSSIRKVVFERMAPNDTLFIEKTAKSTADDINSFISIQMWDLPGGQLDPGAWNLAFEDMDAVIFVLDAQSTFNDMIRKLAVTMQKAFDANAGIQFEIFLHKIDGMSEDYRLDTLQNLRDRLTEELFDISPDLESSMNVFYHLTSVFDTSIYEALSKVIQKLIPEQAMLERLLDLLCQQCSMDKAFLFDTSSKIYIATDSSPLDNQTYVICSDYIDLIGDFALLYEPSPLGSPFHSRSPSTGSRSNTLAPMSRMDSSAVLPSSPTAPRRATSADAGRLAKGARMPSSKVKLSTGATIAQWGINNNLSLVALLRPHMMEQHAALIDYNVSTFREAVLAIFDLHLGQGEE
ncbi:Gtr1/RagA G protein conserved region-domain-containing protein [Leucosporidium creatinivorum]|uniref:GTP-binding protein n=1 Tax=Leucosporidium creatinivorum TaxID=106004 RepID=A0A1Y2FL38_9BASI|nr:Gtr1/RagA G protein conserved region-domain-containing protein [Leucosporidium creatinivorum]